MTDPDETLTITTRRDGATTLVILSGELDMHSSEHLSAALAGVLDGAPAAIGIDARELTFTDSAGLRALLVALLNQPSRGLRAVWSASYPGERPRDLRLLTARADRELPTRPRAIAEAAVYRNDS